MKVVEIGVKESGGGVTDALHVEIGVSRGERNHFRVGIREEEGSCMLSMSKSG